MVEKISYQEKKYLDTLHADLESTASKMGWSTAAASFLIIGALIVITCSCWCLRLGAVNVLSQIIIPGVIPSIIAIGAAAPFVVVAYRLSGAKNIIRKNMIDAMEDYLRKYNIFSIKSPLEKKNEKKQKEADLKERAKFILINFLNWTTNTKGLVKNRHWTLEYQSKISSDLKDRLGKKKDWKKELEEEEDEGEKKKIQKKIDAKEAMTKIFDEVRTEIYANLK